MVDFDSLVDDSQAKSAPVAQESMLDKIALPHAPQAEAPQSAEHQDFDSLVSDEDKYHTPGQQAKAFIEGVGKGALGPIATAIETGGKDVTGPFKPLLEHFPGLGVKKEDIAGRAETGAHTAGEVAGFVGSALLGTGEAAVMSELGGAAAKAAGLAAPVSMAAKIGSSAVKNAVEMAVMQSGDEVSKRFLGDASTQDPDTAAQTALGNIGLAAALGGGAGAVLTGVVSPLWKAKVAPKLDEFLGGLNNKINGGTAVMPEAVQKAVTDLGIEPHPVMKGALSGDPKALQHAQYLYRSENPEFMKYMRQLPEQASKAVAESLGVPLESIGTFSNKESGDLLHEMFTKQVDKEYKPIAEALQKRDLEAAKIAVPDEARLDFASQIMEKAIQEGTDSPYYKIYEDYAQRVLAKDTVGGMDKLKTELFNKSSMDRNEKYAWQSIRGMIGDFQESQIMRQAGELGMEGKALGKDLIAERLGANASYREYANKLDELTNFLGVGDFRGTGTLKEKISGITSEDLLKKFSTKGDVEGAEFLKKNFPEISEQVRQHEAKQFLKSSVYEHLGETQLNSKTLNNKLDALMKGSPEYAKSILPEGAIDKIKAAKTINDAISNITNIKDSGTPAGITKLLGKFGANAIGAVGWLAGHNPIASAVVGHLTQLLSVDAPQAIKLAALKHMATDAPIKAEGFKAMVGYIQQNIKAEKYLNSAIDGVFKTGARVNIYQPSSSDLMKLDKLVAKNQDNPDEQVKKLSEGHVGHYMPDHQAAIAKSTIVATQYLQSIKPRPTILGPLDKPIDPSPAQQARYDRALTIAESPMIVLEHIKNGTLQTTDIQDLGSMYPSVYKAISVKLTTAIADAQHAEEPIPYGTRIGLSLFLGQPLDSTMTPANIMAAQPVPKVPPEQGGTKSPGGSPSKLNKMPTSFKTPNQAAESDRSTRD